LLLQKRSYSKCVVRVMVENRLGKSCKTETGKIRWSCFWVNSAGQTGAQLIVLVRLGATANCAGQTGGHS